MQVLLARWAPPQEAVAGALRYVHCLCHSSCQPACLTWPLYAPALHRSLGAEGFSAVFIALEPLVGSRAHHVQPGTDMSRATSSLPSTWLFPAWLVLEAEKQPQHL